MDRPKIQIIRDEFSRIGCDFTSLTKPFSVYWNYEYIVVQGRRVRQLAYEALCILLSSLPDKVGENAFWELIDKTDMDQLYDEVNRRILAENERKIALMENQEKSRTPRVKKTTQMKPMTISKNK